MASTAFFLQVQPPAGVAPLKVARLTGTERLGRPFEYHLELTSTSHTITAESVLGKALQVEVNPGDGAGRIFHGMVTEFEYLGSTTTYAGYRAVLRPWVWLLSRRATCRIFQNMKAPDIILQVFRDAGFQAFANGLTGSYEPLEYCVQYRESDLDFVTRLMEQEGIYYFFIHEDGKHTLKLMDGSTGHPSAPEATLPFVPSDSALYGQFFSRWGNARQLLTGKYLLNDYNFENPTGDLTARGVLKRNHAFDELEVYDYPGPYQAASPGSQYARVRMQEAQADYDIGRGEGPLTSLTPGESFTLSEHPRDDQNRKYITLSTTYEIEAGQHEIAGAMPEDYSCKCVVEAFPASTNYRLPSITRKPRISGPQTAVVVGPSDKEIFTDKYGRVKLKFHWDLFGEKGEKASCWVRVAQLWAGGGWGAMHIPRIGQEVVVEFLEGDPDRPLVTGRVYNAQQMPPYELTTNETQSGLKTRSTPGGDPSMFNELRFEDKKGQEHIYFHAEKDFQRVVENNDSLKVGFDKKDKGDQTIEIFNNQTITIGDPNASEGNRTTTLKLGNDKLVLEKGNRDVILEKGNDTHTLKSGNREAKLEKGNDTITLAQGDHTIKLTAGKSVIDAGTSIELKVGQNSIKIDQSGIQINAATIKIAAQAKLTLSGNAGADLTASGPVQVQGAIVKIN